MKRHERAAGSCVMAMVLSGCIATGQDPVSISLHVAGSDLVAPVEGRDGFVIELDEASLVFGPLYLCAGVLAGDNCETARLEWLDAVVVNALDPIGVEAGQLTGFTGPVRSAMYDFGIMSLLTAPAPVPLAAVDALEGNSVRLAGTATRGPDSVAFRIAFPIRSGSESQLGVSVVRVNDAGELGHEVTGDEGALMVRFDASSWLGGVDFTLGLPPAAEIGELPAGEGSQAERAVGAAILLGQRARFEWAGSP